MKIGMKQQYLFPAAAMLFLAGCGDSPHITNTRPNPDPSPTPEITDYYVSPSCSDCKTEVKTNISGGYRNILGRGYDVTGDYLSPSSLRASVIDLRKQADLDLLSIFSAPASSMGQIISGKNPSDFLSALMADAGIESDIPSGETCFNATLNTLSSNASYILSNNWTRSEIVKAHSSKDYILKTLSDEFIADTATLKPKALIEKYGTHFLVSTSLGLSVRTLYGAYVDASSSEKESLAYKGYMFAEQSLLDKLGPDLSLTLAGINNYGATLTKTFSGGDVSLVEYDPETGKLGDTSSWQASMDNDNLALITLSDGDLLPLSYAVKDASLKSQIDVAISNYIKESKIKADATVPLLQNSNGRVYRYVTSYDESMQLADKGGLKFYGVLGSLYRDNTTGTIPLYSHVYTDGSQILSLIQPTNDWECIGYVMKERTPDTVSLYEISDGTRFAYTIEASNSYGPRKEWHPTGVVFYLVRP